MHEARTAVVTGASSGVGRATAMALAEVGLDVALVARRRESLEQTAQHIAGQGGRAVSVVADLRDPRAAERAMEEARTALGPVDALINCLGTNIPNRGLADMTPEDWNTVIATNLSAVYYCVRALLPSMRERGAGMIVSISSLAALQASTLSGSAYSASKAGLNMLSACINLEDGPNGVRSCVICPGDINTGLLDKRPEPPNPERRRHMLQPRDVADLVVAVLRQPEHAWVDEVVVRPRAVIN